MFICQRGQLKICIFGAPPMLIEWAAITADGRSPLVLIDRVVKINAEYYRKNMLEGALKRFAANGTKYRKATLEQHVTVSLNV